MRKQLILILLSVICISTISFATKVPKGNFCASIVAEKGLFNLCWYNNVDKSYYSMALNSSGEIVEKKQISNQYIAIEDWKKYDNLATLNNWLRTDFYLTRKQINNVNIIGGIDAKNPRGLILLLYDEQRNTVIKSMFIDNVSVFWGRPRASNIIVAGDKVLVSYIKIYYLQNLPYLDICIAKWDIQSNEITYKLIEKNIDITSISLAAINNTIALAYDKKSETSGQSEIKVDLIDMETMKLFKEITTEKL